MKKHSSQIWSWLLLVSTLCACTQVGAETRPAVTATAARPTITATSAPECAGIGSMGTDHVPNPTQGFSIYFQYYLPPCYQERSDRSYPVLYLMTLSHEEGLSLTDNTPLSLANRLIVGGKLPPVIVVVPGQLVGADSDVALTRDLVPYVDGKYRTIRDRLHRGVGGVSNGAAIAVRMGFQFPETFGSVGMLSGGIADNEAPRFTEWIRRTPPGKLPRLHIDVGDQDSGILNLLHNLLLVLDANHVPYTLNVGHGDHKWAFWSPLMEPYLIWFSQAW
jgi:enterochelin esterase-like enzyme